MTLIDADRSAPAPPNTPAQPTTAAGGAAPIRTFHPRQGRLSRRHHDALDRLWPTYGIDVPTAPGPGLNLAARFGRRAPVVLEIGSGMGETTAAMAAADPDRDYLAVEVHIAGIANLLSVVQRLGSTNVRVARGDAIDLLRYGLPADSLDAVHVFFPDPWPKSRHHKRRLIQPTHVALIRSRLVPGGVLHCATDWAEYAEVMLRTLTADPDLVNTHPGYAPRPPHRPVTRFERRGVAAGHPIRDLIFRRRQ